ncbi:hypothetical protein T4E_2989 [Trichinella pseudospiralis]|uniref:Uncharacterized protein n=1 Tax=Trichinella pseudospiralis TaxID=6337 RepID=A0A0V0YFM7_TRIPS|nr:hypothetical protein T4E_2989 [Trichinella pseudospiralis]
MICHRQDEIDQFDMLKTAHTLDPMKKSRGRDRDTAQHWPRLSGANFHNFSLTSNTTNDEHQK